MVRDHLKLINRSDKRLKHLISTLAWAYSAHFTRCYSLIGYCVAYHHVPVCASFPVRD